jgi:hypothetical protein
MAIRADCNNAVFKQDGWHCTEYKKKISDCTYCTKFRRINHNPSRA